MGAPLTVLHLNFIPFVWHFGVYFFWGFFCWFVYFLPPSSSHRDPLVYFLMTKCLRMLSKGHVSWLPFWSPDLQ